MASEVPPKPKMVVYGGTPPGPPRGPKKTRSRGGWWKRRPRWLKITAGVIGAVLLVAVAVGGYAAWKLDSVYNSVTKLSKNDKAASKLLAPTIPEAGSPITALLVGSDHRGKTVDGQYGLSDTLMLVRIDPKHHMASLFSIPRDLWVTVPGYGTGKINGAYSTGGDKLALAAVKEVTGVHPNYLLNVDFQGFRDLVNALGGVYINVDQHYYNPPSVAPSSGWSEIDINPGYQQLSGKDALAFSRYRHTDEDFHREARQQTFLKAFENRASTRFNGISITDLPAINDLINAIKGNLTIVGPGGSKVGLSTLQSFVATVYGVRSHVASIKPPAWQPYTGTDGAAAETVDPAALQHSIYIWKHPWLVATAKSSIPGGKPKKPAKPKWTPAVTPSAVTVTVLNGNGVTGDAGKATKQLKAWGYLAHAGGNAPNYSFPQSVVYYKAGGKAAATDIAHIVGSATVMPLPATMSKVSKPVALVLGKSYKGAIAVQPPATTTKTTTDTLPATLTPTTEYRDYFQQAAHHVHFRTLYPTVSQASSEFCPYNATDAVAGECSPLLPDPIRTYNLPAAGKGDNSMYAMFKFSNTFGEYWGVEETRFVDAPILQNPNATRDLDGRHYLFFFNGAHIQTIGFVNAGIAYWVQNTLLDGLTNPEMIAIARSLKPVTS